MNWKIDRMCKHDFVKVNTKTKKDMHYCVLLSDEKDEMRQLCLYQKFCRDENAYLLNNEHRCKNFVSND